MTKPYSSIPNVSFDNIINFRDVGRTINQFAGKKYSSDFVDIGDVLMISGS
jgi:hypothetical protein